MRRKQELVLDGIEESFRFLRLSYKRMLDSLILDELDATDADLLGSVILDCWTIIDHAKRLRTLLIHTPGLRKTTRLRVFLDKTNQIPNFRDRVQHLEERVTALAPTGLPVWGSVSWARLLPENNFRVTMYAPGRLAKCEGIPVVNPAGREFHAEIDHIELSIEDQTINISELVRLTEQLATSFTNAVEQAEKTGVRDENDLLRFELETPGVAK
jgi:hypothetical protein